MNGYLKMPVPDSNEVGDDPKDQPLDLVKDPKDGYVKGIQYRFILT